MALPSISLIYPKRVLAISVTGSHCSRHCSHCSSYYLKGMLPITELTSESIANYSSALISGGMDGSLQLPLTQWCSQYRFLKEHGLKLNFHTGLISDLDLEKIAEYVDCASFDLIGDRDTIQNVYHAELTPEIYFERYNYIKSHVPCVPHLTVGLNAGAISGEFSVIDFLATDPPEKLVFLIFIPTRGTDFAAALPPSIEETERLFAFARKKLPDCEFLLGCMHPRGEIGFAYESLAVKYNFSTIVMPSRRSISELSSRYYIKYGDSCCAL